MYRIDVILLIELWIVYLNWGDVYYNIAVVDIIIWVDIFFANTENIFTLISVYMDGENIMYLQENWYGGYDLLILFLVKTK